MNQNRSGSFIPQSSVGVTAALCEEIFDDWLEFINIRPTRKDLGVKRD